MPVKKSTIPLVGLDIVEVIRFKKFKKVTDPFLNKVFSEKEIQYCFSHKDPSVHLAGFFALKEAVSKALGTTRYPFAEIEVRHSEDGAPAVFHKGKKLKVGVSISHTKDTAIAIAAS